MGFDAFHQKRNFKTHASGYQNAPEPKTDLLCHTFPKKLHRAFLQEPSLMKLADLNTHGQVFIVEDDLLVQKSLKRALAPLDLELNVYDKPSEILSVAPPNTAACVLVDLRLPEMTGLDLLQSLRSNGWLMPFVVVTGFGSVPGAVSAMQLGAMHFLEKPVDDVQLSNVVISALNRDQEELFKRQERIDFVEKLSSLTPRETEVLDAVVQGKLNKQIAKSLSLSVKTIELHKSNLRRKLKVDSVAQLVRLVTEVSVAETMAVPKTNLL